MVSWATAMMAWDVAMDIAMMAVDILVIVHVAMGSTGLASSEKF